MNVQDMFLNQVRVTKTPVLIYLMGGHQMRGTIYGFDPFSILLETGDKLSLVYKHAISTVAPQAPVKFAKPTKEQSPSKSDSTQHKAGSSDEQGT